MRTSMENLKFETPIPLWKCSSTISKSDVQSFNQGISNCLQLNSLLQSHLTQTALICSILDALIRYSSIKDAYTLENIKRLLRTRRMGHSVQILLTPSAQTVKWTAICTPLILSTENGSRPAGLTLRLFTNMSTTDFASFRLSVNFNSWPAGSGKHATGSNKSKPTSESSDQTNL